MLALAHHQYDTSEFAARKAAAVVQAHRVQPHLGAIGIALDMNVWRITPGQFVTATRTSNTR
jgi:hypothetical protein